MEYPPGTNFGVHLNCEGVPATAPITISRSPRPRPRLSRASYGTDPSALPGHDHLVDPPGGADWNIAWEVVEVVFTNKAHVSHLTTEDAIDAAVAAGNARMIDLGFAFHCSSVSAAKYNHGTPVG